MGAIQVPTPAMGPYRVEIRSESFYLTHVDAPAQYHLGRFEILVPASDAPKILAALDQVTSHQAWMQWQRPTEGELRNTSWTLDPDGAGLAPTRWTVTPDQAALNISGPWVVYYEHQSLQAEIPYEAVSELREALKAVVSDLTRPHP